MKKLKQSEIEERPPSLEFDSVKYIRFDLVEKERKQSIRSKKLQSNKDIVTNKH